jgi:hypothetical protein
MQGERSPVAKMMLMKKYSTLVVSPMTPAISPKRAAPANVRLDAFSLYSGFKKGNRLSLRNLKGHYHDGKDDEPKAGMNTSPDVW